MTLVMTAAQLYLKGSNGTRFYERAPSIRSMSESVSDLVRKRRSARMLQGGVIKYIAHSEPRTRVCLQRAISFV